MTIFEFKNLIADHDDIMLHYGVFRFTIMTCFDKLLICEQKTENEMYYDTADDMLNEYHINKDRLIDVMGSVVLDSCS